MIDFEQLAFIYSQSVTHQIGYGSEKSHLTSSLRKIFPWLALFDIMPDGLMRYRVVGGGEERVVSRIGPAGGLLESWILEYTRKEFGK